MNSRKEFVDLANLQEYDQLLKQYIDTKIAEAIEAYRMYDESNDSDTSFVIDDDE